MFAIEETEANTREAALNDTPSDVITEAEDLLADESLIYHIAGAMENLGVSGEQYLVMTLYLIGTSRLLSQPVAAIVRGPSSSGKSYVIDKVAATFPEESLVQATEMTTNALYYMPAGQLEHAFVVAGERKRKEQDDNATATKALRELLSSGVLRKCVTTPDPTTGEMETRTVQQQGPIAYVESTTAQKVFPEDANRCLMLETDERPEQTRMIVQAIVQHAAGKRPVDRPRQMLVLKTLQRLLEQTAVVIPFAERLGELFPSERTEARRAIGQLLSMIQASAVLHQRQRSRTAAGIVLAEQADYELVHLLLAQPMVVSLNEAITTAVRRFYEKLLKHFWDGEPFVVRAASQQLQMSERQTGDNLRTLLQHGGVEQVEASRGPIPAQWRVLPEHEFSESSSSAIPSVEAVFGESEMPAVPATADLNHVPF